MATVITSECINCGACEPECPNTAIYQGGVPWELNGATHDAISGDIFYIVPEKCTECVGFFDHEACAAVCPVDCCVPDPNIPETEDVLIARAKTLHPDTQFGSDFPSRFRANGEAASAPAAAAPATDAAPVTPAAAAPAKAAAPAAAATAPSGRVEKPLTAPKPAVSAPQPTIRKNFDTEMSIPFEEALARLSQTRGKAGGTGKTLGNVLALVLQPILGALPPSQKKTIEEAVGNKWVFTSAGATGVNILQNFILYPAITLAVGALTMNETVFSKQTTGMIVLGVAIACFEAIWRLREAVLYAAPQDEVVYRGALYWPPLAVAAAPLTGLLRRSGVRGSVAVDGFHGGDFEEKTERERRYGEVYTLTEKPNGYLLTLEFARRVPKSAQKEEMGIADEMPDYDYELALEGNVFIVRGHVLDPNIRKLAGVSPAFPPDFTTKIDLPKPVSGFKHRVENKTLEVVLLK